MFGETFNEFYCYYYYYYYILSFVLKLATFANFAKVNCANNGNVNGYFDIKRNK